MALFHVDLTNNPNSSEFTSISKQIRKALENQGCFLVDYDDVSSNLRKDMFELMEKLHDLPKEVQENAEKMPGEKIIYKGSQLFQSVAFVGAHDIDIDLANKFATLMWPNENIDKSSKTLKAMCEKMEDLSVMLTKMIFHAYQVEEHYDSYMATSQNHLFSMIKYPPPMTNEPMPGVVGHVDPTYFTILAHNNYTTGLMVQFKNDDQWHHIDLPGKNTFVVLSGLLLKAWSNGRIHVPVHKVILKGDKARLTCVLFIQPKDDHYIEVPDELVAEENPLLFKSFTFGEFHKFYYTQGHKFADELVEFAGIKARDE